MKTSCTRTLIGALAALAVVPAHAQFYVGASAGRSDVSIDTKKRADEFLDLGFDSAKTSSDDNDIAYRAFVGYQFMPYLGVEAAYVDLGSFSFRTDVQPTGSFTGKPKINGAELSLVGRLPIGDRFAVYARAGAFRARTRTAYAGDGSVELADGAERQSKHGTEPAYAVGASYAFTPSLGLRAEWARYMNLGGELTGGKTNANLVSVGLVYSF